MANLDLNRLVRPRQWEDIIGQKFTVSLLREALLAGSFPKFSLFSGPAGVGKSCCAEIAAMALACEDKKDEPCLKCESCKAFLEEKPYKILKYNMSAKSKHGDIVQLLDEIFNFESIHGRTIYILEEPQGILAENQRPFLEELTKIPEDVYIMMCTTQPYLLIPEIRGRATQFELEIPSATDSVEFLKKLGNRLNITLPGRNKLVQFVNLCQNNPREIVKYFEILTLKGALDTEVMAKLFKTVENRVYVSLMQSLCGEDSVFDYTKLLVKCKEENGTQFTYMIRGFREFLINAIVEVSTGTPEPTLTGQEREDLKIVMKKVGEGKFLKLMERLSQADGDVYSRESSAEFFLVSLKFAMQDRSMKAMLTENKREAYNSRISSTKEARAVKINEITKRSDMKVGQISQNEISSVTGITQEFTED